MLVRAYYLYTNQSINTKYIDRGRGRCVLFEVIFQITRGVKFQVYAGLSHKIVFTLLYHFMQWRSYCAFSYMVGGYWESLMYLVPGDQTKSGIN